MVVVDTSMPYPVPWLIISFGMGYIYKFHWVYGVSYGDEVSGVSYEDEVYGVSYGHGVYGGDGKNPSQRCCVIY